MILSFPWLVLSFLAYNVVAFTHGRGEAADPFGRTVATFTMLSGGVWKLTWSDAFIAATLVLLFVEIVKATRTTATSIIDHVLSMILFVVCLVEFIVRPEAATSAFFILTLVTFIDVIAGFTVTIKAARRDLAIGAT